MNYNVLLIALCLFLVTHSLVWFSVNLQFVSGEWADKSLLITLVIGIPTSLAAYYASRYGYMALEESAWGVRFLGFGTSYLVFPILTWFLLGESMFTLKTTICIFLSVLILLIQIFM